MITDRGRTRSPAWRSLPAVLALAVLAAAPPSARAQIMDREIHGLALVDRLEWAPGRAGEPVVLDALGWLGGDVNRAWVRVEGAASTTRSEGELETALLFGRIVAPYWDALAGVRMETGWGDGSDARFLLEVGLVGLAPYWFEVAPTLRVSQDGDLSAELEVEYEVLFTQRLVMQPRLELTAAVQDVPERGVGAGLNAVELGARLRYEIRRELAPYLGVGWIRRTFDTAELARTTGEPVSSVSVVAGVRAWY